MNSLSLIVLDEAAGRPTGNPFKVRAVRTDPVNDYAVEIGTGLSIGLTRDMDLKIRSLLKDVFILGHWTSEDGELTIGVFARGWGIDQGMSKEFAEVTIVEQTVKPVRFVETKEGSRVIVGGPEEATNNG